MHEEQTTIHVDIRGYNGTTLHDLCIVLHVDHTVTVTLDGKLLQSADYEKEYRRLRNSIAMRGLTFDDIESEPSEPPKERRPRHQGRTTTTKKMVQEERNRQADQRRLHNQKPYPGR